MLRPSHYLMNGFIRETEKEFQLSSHIPDQVIVVIILFYELPSNRPIIIDTGSSTTKAGLGSTLNYYDSEEDEESDDDEDEEYYTCDDKPRAIFPSAIDGGVYPIKDGLITDWRNVQKLWSHTINRELLITSKGASILMTESPLNTKSNREKMTEIMFEEFKVDRFYIIMDAVASLYASGKTTGLVVSSGYSTTHIVPIYEGYSMRSATNLQQAKYPVLTMNIGGKHITDYLLQLLTEKNLNANYDLTVEIAEDIKKKHCYISKSGIDEDGIKKYKLPDGRMIEVGKERFRAPESLFNPELIGSKEAGITEKVYESIMGCYVDMRRDMYANIVLAGGNTMYAGLKHRLKEKVWGKAPIDWSVRVEAPPERKHSSWMGGAILASLSTFQEMMITREEYGEKGAIIVHEKCVS